jgi:hypothetical protein
VLLEVVENRFFSAGLVSFIDWTVGWSVLDQLQAGEVVRLLDNFWSWMPV